MIGATGVLVGSEYYDVEFIDGTAQDLFLLTPGAYPTPFTTEISALEASQALADQVFNSAIPGPCFALANGTTDFTRGIDNVTGFINRAWILTVWKIESDEHYSTVTQIFEGGGLAQAFPDGFAPRDVDHDLAFWEALTFARWTTASPPAVPEPATFMMLGIGLLGLAGINRKRVIQ